MTSAPWCSSLPLQLSPEPAHTTRHEAVVTTFSCLSSLLQTLHTENRECTHGISRFEQHAVNKLWVKRSQPGHLSCWAWLAMFELMVAVQLHLLGSASLGKVADLDEGCCMWLDVSSLAGGEGDDEAGAACPGVQPNASLHQSTQLWHLCFTHIRQHYSHLTNTGTAIIGSHTGRQAGKQA